MSWTRNEGGENNNPLRYYENLRNSSASFTANAGSQIIEVELQNEERVRLMHIAQILPQTPSSFDIYMNAAGVLALKHFNKRSNVVVPNLSETLEGCNLYMTMDLLNSQSSPVAATSHLYSYFTHEHTLQAPHPASVVGASLSRVSRSLSILTGGYEIPQISPASSAAALDNADISPMFGRTIPTNAGDAEASAVYCESLGVTHFGIIFVGDDFGNHFQKDLALAAGRRGIKVVSVSFREEDSESLANALKILKESNLRYIFAIIHEKGFAQVLEQAFDAGLVGDEYTWYLPELDPILEPGFALNRKGQAKVAAAVQGSSVVGIQSFGHPEFEESLSSFQTDPDFQSFFFELHADNSAYFGVNLTEVIPSISQYSYTTYDAVIALGIAGCQADENLFSGADHFQRFKTMTFNGASGPVAFDPVTGTRRFETLEYTFTNVYVDGDMSDNETVVFQSRVSTLIDFNSEQVVNELHPTIYSDGSSNRPSPLPPLEDEMNLVPTCVFAVGWFLAGLLILCCFALGWFVHRFRKKQIVRAAQPSFLGMLLVGTLLMASSIIPMTFQEPTSQRGLDIACMATPWLLVCGFSTAFSAIFAKCWRIHIVVREAMCMQRVTVDPSDVLLPFLILMVTNIMFLVVWTVEAPLVWTRVPLGNYDAFGRPVETYGICKGRVDEDDGSDLSIIFIVALGMSDALVVVIAYYQAYSIRRLPAQFNDSPQMTLCMLIVLESLLIGFPILFLVSGNPTAFFLVKALVVSACCFGLLVPIFLPKLRNQRRADVDAKASSMICERGSYVARASPVPSFNRGLSSKSHSHASQDGWHGSSVSGRQRSQKKRLSSSIEEKQEETALPSSVAALKRNITRRNMEPQALPSRFAEN